MLGLRLTVCLTLLTAAGCGNPQLSVGVSARALNSCNVVADCPPLSTGVCVTQVCTAQHECDVAMDTTNIACTTGCTIAAECSLGVAYCYAPACNGGTCDFTVPPANTTCECRQDSDCNAMAATG